MNRRILNLGAGTQSSVLLVMADRGEIEPVEVAIFADTQAEPREVYEHLNWLEKQVKTPVVRVTAGSLREAALRGRVSKKSGRVWAKGLPYWTRDANGKIGLMTRRQCTADFKITPINRWIMKNILKSGRMDKPMSPAVTRIFGISYDEKERMRMSKERWAENDYPLVEMRMTRQKVIEKAAKWFHGRVFPRSACTFCPFHQNDEWRRIRDTMPDEWQAAIEFDEQARELHAQPNAAMNALVYVHRDGVPLKDANIDAPKADEFQASLFGMKNECDGMCGV